MMSIATISLESNPIQMAAGKNIIGSITSFITVAIKEGLSLVIAC